ncbi:MAG: hypothetical protein MR763_01040 [Clostridiales bacterium]|nr:hypothetical protein [Clostridiales bacterium]
MKFLDKIRTPQKSTSIKTQLIVTIRDDKRTIEETLALVEKSFQLK